MRYIRPLPRQCAMALAGLFCLRAFGATLNPVADAYVESVYPVNNYGFATTLLSKAATVKIEAETFSSQFGVQNEPTTDTGGGQDVGYIHNGDYTVYNNINLTGVTSIDIRLASNNVGGSVEVRTGSPTGPLLGTVTVGYTGGWQVWTTKSATLVGADGIQTLYLVYKGGAHVLFNVNWFQLNGKANESYLRYDLSGITGTITSAKLILTSAGPAASGTTNSVAYVSDDTWSETTLNWSNKPAAGAIIGSWSAPTAAGTAVSVDITAQAAAEHDGDRMLSLCVYSTGGMTTYSSKDATSNKPVLEITTTYAAIPITVEPEVLSLISSKWSNNFTHVTYPTQVLTNVITVTPGSSIQAAVDSASAAGGGIVLLKAGTHLLTSQITLKNKVTLFGEGRTRTILKQDPSFSTGSAIGAATGQLTDVLIKNLTLDGLQTGTTNGILLAGADPNWHTRIMLQNVDVTNWAGMGVHMKRTSNIIMDNCKFQYNGASNGLYHNIYFLYTEEILQSDCDMSYPVLGKGNKYTATKNLIAQRCNIQGCIGNGIQADHTNDNHLFFHKYNISDCGQVAMWFPCENFNNKNTYTEDPTYAPQFVILNRCNIVNNKWGCMWRIVGNSYIINSVFNNTNIDCGFLKCGVTFENSTLSKPVQNYTDVSQWPSDVPLLW